MRRWKKPIKYFVAFIVLLYIGVTVGYNIALANNDTPTPISTVQPQETAAEKAEKARLAAIHAKEVELTPENLLRYTNNYRIAAGLQPLTLNAKLNASAQAKAQDMADLNYWDHNRPDGTEPWPFITNAGYSYRDAGENLGCGFEGADYVVSGWYNSPKHRDNLLKPDFKEVGFGVVYPETYKCGDSPGNVKNIIVQHFGNPL